MLPECVANLLWPVKPYLLALTRWAAVLLGITGRFHGDMLGTEQWSWLEEQVAGSEASFHVLVSTVQVLSVNPIAEGWGHYPAAQSRLLALLRKHRPRGLVILSGDVHFAELLVTQPPSEGMREEEKEEKKEALEVTSSGMTHTCFATTMGTCEMAVDRSPPWLVPILILCKCRDMMPSMGLYQHRRHIILHQHKHQCTGHDDDGWSFEVGEDKASERLQRR